MSTKINPDEVLVNLKSKFGKRAHRNLDTIHEICRKIHDGRGQRDYSPTAVGAKSGAVGGPKINTLLSPGGRHFRELIRAWAEFGGTTTAKPSARPAVAGDSVLEAIDDPVIRSLIGPCLAELKRVKAELNLLKSIPHTISLSGDRVDVSAPSKLTRTEVIEPVSALHQQEASALDVFLDQRWQRKNGLKVSSYGQLIAAKDLQEGHALTPIAFIDAISKLRGGKNVTPP